MTIRFLTAWNGYRADQIVSGIAGAEETRLIGLGFATADLDGPITSKGIFATDTAGVVTGLVGPAGELITLGGGAASVSVLSYGADNTGTNSCDAAFASAIATGKDVYVPRGTYKITTNTGNAITLADDQTMFGDGFGSVIRFTGGERCVAVGNRSAVRDLKIQGDGAGAGKPFQTGIFCYQKTGWRIENVWFLDLSGTGGANGGGGIYGTSLIASNKQGGVIRGCRFSGCNGGLVLASSAEYVNASDCLIAGCTTGYFSDSGNNVLCNSNVNGNTTGINIAAGTNDSHGAIVGCQVNHNTTNLVIGAITNGFSISSSFFYSGNITMSGSLGVRMVNCDLSIGTLTLNTAMVLQIAHSRFPVTPTSGFMTQVLNGGSTITSVDNLNF